MCFEWWKTPSYVWRQGLYEWLVCNHPYVIWYQLSVLSGNMKFVYSVTLFIWLYKAPATLSHHSQFQVTSLISEGQVQSRHRAQKALTCTKCVRKSCTLTLFLFGGQKQWTCSMYKLNRAVSFHAEIVRDCKNFASMAHGFKNWEVGDVVIDWRPIFWEIKIES